MSILKIVLLIFMLLVGFIAWCLCVAAKRADRMFGLEYYEEEEKKE